MGRGLKTLCSPAESRTPGHPSHNCQNNDFESAQLAKLALFTLNPILLCFSRSDRFTHLTVDNCNQKHLTRKINSAQLALSMSSEPLLLSNRSQCFMRLLRHYRNKTEAAFFTYLTAGLDGGLQTPSAHSPANTLCIYE